MIKFTRLIDEAGGVEKFVLKKELIQKLSSQGIKHTPEDIVVIGKNPEGKILWLEKGNAEAGLKHIVEGHTNDFLARGIREADIPLMIEELIKIEPIEVGRSAKGPFSIYEFKGKKYKLAYGDNGYIVSLYPV